MTFSLAIKTPHVKVVLKTRHTQLPWFQQRVDLLHWSFFNNVKYLSVSFIVYVQITVSPTEVQTIRLLLFPMENVNDYGWIPAMYFNKACWCYKTALSKRKKTAVLCLLSGGWLVAFDA